MPACEGTQCKRTSDQTGYRMYYIIRSSQTYSASHAHEGSCGGYSSRVNIGSPLRLCEWHRPEKMTLKFRRSKSWVFIHFHDDSREFSSNIGTKQTPTSLDEPLRWDRPTVAVGTTSEAEGATEPRNRHSKKRLPGGCDTS